MESINEKRPKIRYKAHTKGVRISFVSVFCVVFDIAIDISDNGKIVLRLTVVAYIIHLQTQILRSIIK